MSAQVIPVTFKCAVCSKRIPSLIRDDEAASYRTIFGVNADQTLVGACDEHKGRSVQLPITVTKGAAHVR